MKKYVYQYNFSVMHPGTLYDIGMREQKARKMLSVLDEYYCGNLGNLRVLDVGCSTGIVSRVLSERLGVVVGIDIDEAAMRYACENERRDKVFFCFQDSMDLAFADNVFDVVICSHIYEHVPDPNRLLSEIYRVLKPDGVCFFAAGNKWSVIEAHYNLFLLSVIPKPLAHLYLRLLKRGKFYYEKHLTLWGLRRLVSRFEIIDYTSKIIRDPQKYHATEMLHPGSLKHKLAMFIACAAYWLCPVYIWLLRKKAEGEPR